MIHLGDITKIRGCAVPITDVVIGGSPCQDLSVAGKREGLAGARSGLFMEQIRIVKEMRYADQCSGRTGQFIRPRYMVWENVPGAFSSNDTEDFRAVLEEVIRIAEPDAPDIPLPEKGKWPLADCWYGDGWSVAYRVLDAQFWGVPQRRRRIALVADFGGHTAPEILFERNGLCWDSAQGGEAGQGTAGDFEDGAGEAVAWYQNGSGELFVGGNAKTVQTNSNASGRGTQMLLQLQTYGFKLGNSEQARSIGFQEERSPTLNAECGGNKPAILYGIGSYNSAGMLSDNPNAGIYEADTSRTLDLNGGNPACNQGGICIAQCYDMTHASDVIRECGETAPTLQSRMGTGRNQIPLTYQQATVPLMANSHPGSYTGQDAYTDMFPSDGYAVRRLTTLECERLQGYPSRKEIDIREMTKDEYIAWNLQCGNIVVAPESGKVFATRGPGGVRLDKPKELQGSIVNGYKVVSIRNGTTKLQCRIHRIIWISVNGVIPNGYCIDHINNDKQDNRLSNLQLLTPIENSHKAKEDGLYKTGEDNKATKISPELYDEIAYLYATDDFTMRELAEVYDISKSRISQIVRETGWTDIGAWTDGNGKLHKESSDSARYKALGNSIALPPWKWVLKRLCAFYERDATMASLFDGIGGFPLIWEQLNGKGSCLWASEIEEFPIAVTKLRFGRAYE